MQAIEAHSLKRLSSEIQRIGQPTKEISAKNLKFTVSASQTLDKSNS